MENRHDRLGAPATSRRRAELGLGTVNHGVQEKICVTAGTTSTSDGSSITVLLFIRIDEASSSIHGAVSFEAKIGGKNSVLIVELGFVEVWGAIGIGCHVGKKLAKVVITSVHVRTATSVENSCQVGNGSLSLEEV